MGKKILVPLDRSKTAECALSYAADFVKECVAGEVTLFTVVAVDIPWAEAYSKRFDINALRKHEFAASKRYLAKVKARLASMGVTAKTALIEANAPAEAIVDYAGKNGMDMILIATHGYTGMKKMLVGSVAFGVLSQSAVPVHLIRPEACRI